MALLYNLEWDPREEHQVDFPHGWVVYPVAAAAGAFLKSLAIEPPIMQKNLTRWRRDPRIAASGEGSPHVQPRQ